MIVNWEISVGNLIEMTVIAVGGLWTLFSVRAKVEAVSAGVKRLESRASLMEVAIRELEKATIKLAVQDERMNNQDSRMNRLAQELRDLKHGHGFVIDLPGTTRIPE